MNLHYVKRPKREKVVCPKCEGTGTYQKWDFNQWCKVPVPCDYCKGKCYIIVLSYDENSLEG